MAHLPLEPHLRPLIYALTSLIMLFCANMLPFLAINARGMTSSMDLFQAAAILFSDDYRVLSVIVFLCMQLLPIFCLLMVCYLHWRLRRFRRSERRWTKRACRWLFRLMPWTMVEVFLVGVMVSLIKLSSLADISIGYGFWCFFLFCIMYLKTMNRLDKGWLWDRISGPESVSPGLVEGRPALEQGVTHCHGCHAVVSIHDKHCPRCLATIHARTPHSIEHCVAMLITSCILYLPANLMPIMVTESMGQQINSTILGGVVLLWHMHSYPVALVIFVASVLVPIAKILSLFWLCYTVSRGSRLHMRGRTRLYRLTEFVGRWSMVDVFVVAILAALIRMGKIMSIYPGVAAMAFAAVVVVTMIAAMLFDPRLIWDKTISSNKEACRD